MIFFDLAKRNLKIHWIRSFLAILGIIIGVLAIASMGILGHSISLLVANLISDVGDTVIVTPHVAAGQGFIGDPRVAVMAKIPGSDVEAIRKVAAPGRVVPVLRRAEEMTCGDDSGYVTLLGLPAGEISGLLRVEKGLPLRENAPGCLVGYYLAREFGIGPGSRIGIGNQSQRVSGVLEERGFAVDINPDYAIVVTDRWFFETYGDSKEYDQVIVKVSDVSQIDRVKREIDQRLNRREKVVDIFDSRDLLRQYDRIYDQISLFLLSIGAISLVVASVSILNVMIISVTERIHEVGILRSIGASRRDILLMFLYEAMVLGAIGSIIGGVLSIAGGYLISRVAISVMTAGTTFGESASVFGPDTFAFIAGGIFFGVIVSTLSGLYPAWKASRMTPIEALRHE
ncbi:MAG: macrolide transporter ATP-binding /permease protein [Methanoregulaceae archaeon PtaB.Bin056]|jgi:putative ABC transport system permease protein|nr:MAG: macrolide transporter ATP-binding /permease protein [Methanoregulaceae archaeon PtaB.Bin056]